MPLRPQLFPRPIRTPCSHARPQCLYLFSSSIPPTRLRLHPPSTSFHTSTPLLDDPTPTHYETLHLPPSASPQEIKRQFFTLSKQYHPDHNHSPTASTRFVEISEAYHILSVPEKRSQYDAQISESRGGGRSRWGRSDAPTHGSYSSASFAGSRPATGLNKKRTTWRGPPPSFYNSGGYGRHGAKRAEYANHGPGEHGTAGAEAGQESYGDFGNRMGPGQSGQGHEVPHFDDQRHKRMHEHVHEHIYGRRRRTRGMAMPEEFDRSGTFINFLLVSGAIGLIGFTAHFMSDKTDNNKKKDGST